MDALSKAVLATIVYYDVFDFPLTVMEVFKFLINSDRFEENLSREALGVHSFFSASEKKLYPLRLRSVNDNLEFLVKNKELEELNGFYFLPGRENLYQERIEKSKIAELKWKKARRYLFLAQAVPFVEAIFASGSLALGHTDQDSDLDVLVVTKAGRIWLARLLISLAMSLLGVRRKNKQKVAPDKICLNHYIATNSLRISFESLYTAQSLAHLVPVYWKNRAVVENFWKENKFWVEKFLWHWDCPLGYQKRAVRGSRFLQWLKFIREKVLDSTGLADWLEKLARYFQLGRINTSLPGRVMANDRQLEFHPFSAEKEILEKYNQSITTLRDFNLYKEKDSGLR